MFQKILLIFCASFIGNNFSMEITFPLLNKQIEKPLNDKHPLLTSPDITYQIVNYIIQNCNSVDELKHAVLNFALLCKDAKEIIYGENKGFEKGLFSRRKLFERVLEILKSEFENDYQAINFTLPEIDSLQIMKVLDKNLFNCLLDCQKLFINVRNKQNTTALIRSVQTGKLDVLKRLAKVPGIDPRLENADGVTALALAKKRGNPNIQNRSALALILQELETKDQKQKIRKLANESIRRNLFSGND